MTNDDKLERILRHDAATTCNGDEAFTRRVMQALPPARRGVRAWTTPMLVMGSAALGSVLAMALAPVPGGVVQAALDIAHLHMATPAALTMIGIAAALLASAVVLAADPD
jgi:hypothetical protein